MRTIAVTGGTGFVGAALINHLLQEGYGVRALARTPAKLSACKGKVTVVEGGLLHPDAMARLVDGADGLINCAGLTHALRPEDFHQTNVNGAATAAHAAAEAGVRFVQLSSMAARRPDLSPYAKSKFDSEGAVRDASAGNPWIALRLPAIYGPGDEATLPYFRLVKRGIAPEPAANPEPRASILYVEDVAAAVVSAFETAPGGAVYEVGDESPDGYSWREIGLSLGKAYGKPPKRIRAPRPMLAVYARLAHGAAALAGKATFVTPGKIREFFHPDWVARDNLLTDATGWRPVTPLEEGFAKTVQWYEERGML